MEDISDLTYMVYSDPFCQQCIRLVESTVLTRTLEIKIKGQEPTREFHDHVQIHYYPFVRAALRQIYVCGFVAWRKRRTRAGDLVPEALPLGSFLWGVRPSKEGTANRLVEYYVTRCFCNTEAKDIHIVPVVPPVYYGALRGNTLMSPLAVVLEHYRDYKNALRNAQLADCWNTKPQLVYAHKPKQQHSNAAAAVDWVVDRDVAGGNGCAAMNRSNGDYTRYQRLVCAIDAQQIDCSAVNFYPLSDDSELTQLAAVQPQIDVEHMYFAFKEAICNVLGVPTQMVVQSTSSGLNSKNPGGYTTSSRLFTNSMSNLARQLAHVLGEVYFTIYKQEAAFIISPISRLEVQSYDTVQALLESEIALPPETRSMVQQDLHFQLTGQKLKRCALFRYAPPPEHSTPTRLACMHTSSGAISFAVQGARIVLTKNDLLVNTESRPSSREETLAYPTSLSSQRSSNNETARDPDIEMGTKNKTKTSSPLPPRAMRISPWITVPLHMLVAVLLVMSLFGGLCETTCQIILSAPCLWLLPVLLDVFASGDVAGPSMRSCGGFMYIVLFPIWISNVSHGENPVLQGMLAIMVMATGLVFFSPRIVESNWAIILVFLAATFALPLPILVAESIPSVQVSCTCILSVTMVQGCVSSLYPRPK